MADRDMQGFPVRTEKDANLRRSAIDMAAMVEQALAAGHQKRVIGADDIIAYDRETAGIRFKVARERAKRGVRSPGSLQARSITVRFKKGVA